MENLFNLLSESRPATNMAGRFFNYTILMADLPMTDMFWNMVRFIAATGFVAILAYYATKKLASSRKLNPKDGNLSVVESLNVGGNAVVRLVKAGEKFLVIGVTKEKVTLLTELDKEQVTEPETVEIKTLDTPFGRVLSRFITPKDEPSHGEPAQRDEDKREK
ncbi:MAG: flagellar biosynthetic protein FliO [Defluviitaleaceae bacterium]|nr:flagellar biosynthetic protein FliO [Defluviitaleaceae bacterium]